MFIQKIRLPMRYKEGVTLNSSAPIFYYDGSCFELGRKITIRPNLSKEKIISVEKDHVVEWTVFFSQSSAYTTAMKVYRKQDVPSGDTIYSCDKYLFTRSIENLLHEADLYRTDGLKSAQMFELENAVCYNPQFLSDTDEIFFNYDRLSFIEAQIERVLLTGNKLPLFPVAKDLILKKEVGSDILVDPDTRYYSDDFESIDPVKRAVYDLTVPIIQFLSQASPTEKQIVGSLSPHSSQPALFQYIGQHVNEDLSGQYHFPYPFSGKELIRDHSFNNDLYQAIDIFDRSFFDHFCLKLFPKTQTIEVVYYGNTHLYSDKTTMQECANFLHHELQSIVSMLYSIDKWSNNSCNVITVCKTVTEELFIDLVKNGRHENLYVDLCVFDLLAHNLIG